MKAAKLWKRMLNEGAVIPEDGYGWLSDAVMSSPIIVDARPLDDSRKIYEDDFDRISPPMPRFWIEGESCDGDLWGALVTAEAIEAGGFKFSLQGFIAKSGIRPVFVLIGEFATDERGRPTKGHAEFSKEIRRGNERIDEISFFFYTMVCDTLLLLSCKNVSLQAQPIDPEQSRRAVKRFGGTPESYRYHVLVVRPAGAKSDAPAMEIGAMPRHFCRAHFSEYGPEFGKGLLFGKYAGRFFVPSCLKGDRKNGVVEKDYAVKA